MTDIDYISASRGALIYAEITKQYGGIAQFCHDTGEDYSAIHKYVHGALRVGDKVARRLEPLIKFSPRELDKNIPKQLGTNVPVLSLASLKAGNLFLPENSEDYISLNDGLIKAYGWNRESLISIIFDNNSMEPTIQSGSYVVIDSSQKKVVLNKVYALLVYEEFYIRRLDKSPESGKLILLPDSHLFKVNNLFAPTEISHENYNIIGRVVYAPNVL